ncbi:MAG: PQQ-binding-like beta-propeller repeat protein [Armatimonadota bacterium]|nr:PQQ-binding-like beta-propeller repeat protein [Armatimonadota bacterium]
MILGTAMKLLGKAALVCAPFVLLLTADTAWCQDPHWGTFHYDQKRTGYNDLVKDLNAIDPALQTATRGGLGLIWTFPMPGKSAGTESDRIIDNRVQPDKTFFNIGDFWGIRRWDDAYLGDYLQTTGVAPPPPPANQTDPPDPPETTATTEVSWNFPGYLPTDREYRVFVWFPSEPRDSNGNPITLHTQKAIYIVESENSTQRFAMDQTVGGNWVELGTRGFKFSSPQQRVRLINVIGDYEVGKDKKVVADAVMFTPTLNQAVYSSPASATYKNSIEMPVGSTDPGYKPGWNEIPAVYIGVVESPRQAADYNMNYGKVYCVNSDANPARFINRIGEGAGKEIWRYPADTAIRQTHPLKDLEGPIEGGIYSSPTVAEIDGRKMVFFSAMDRQTYALDATTGELIWKGPGETVSEPATASGWGLQSSNEAFGGSFLSATASTSGGSSVEWAGPGAGVDIFNYGALSTDPDIGHAYAIYVWLPSSPSDTAERATDAEYTITYDGGKTTDPIKLNQELARGASRWVKLRMSYWNVEKVTLTNMSNDGDYPQVVADAIMFVPEYLGQFIYSSPALAGDNVIIGNLNGRVYALKAAGGTTPGATIEQWVYPEVRIKNIATNDQAPLGPFVATPAIEGVAAFIGSTNGRFYRLSPITIPPDPAATVMFPDKNASATSGFSATAAIDDGIYVGSIDGILYKLDKTSLAAMWQFPIDDGVSETVDAVGAFRYSSPAIRDNIVYSGSSDGRVYAVNKADGTGAWDQLLSGPVYSSCALDKSLQPTIFAATMNGNVWWMNSNNGTMPYWAGRHIGSRVFSSPAVSKVSKSTEPDASYMYVGSDDGRLYAFSSTVNGGWWSGDPDLNPEPVEASNLQQPDPASSVQVQIVDNKTYDKITKSGNPEYFVLGDDLANYPEPKDGHEHGKDLRLATPPGYGVGGSSKEVIYEWGESIHVIIWNLNKKADLEGNVTVDMFSSSRSGSNTVPGDVGSGGVESGSQPKSGTVSPSQVTSYTMTAGAESGTEKSWAYYKFDIPKAWMQQGNNRPPGPGSAWIIQATMKVKVLDEDGKKLPGTSITARVPELDAAGKPGSYKPQYVSINNPLAIMGPDGTKLGWPSNYSLTTGTATDPPRGDRMARVNGKGATGAGGVEPVITFPPTNHGNNSEAILLHVMDRSSMGLSGQSLDKFRIDPSDLYWRGGVAAVVNPLPWDWQPTEERGNWQEMFSGLQNAYVGSQKDYPDIRQRYEHFTKLSDGKNPAMANAPLLGATVPPSGGRMVVADPVETYVDVPRFQPANDTVSGDTSRGYIGYMQAYLDMNSNGQFEDGNFISGDPTTYIEPFRPFIVKIGVLPDFRIRVEESLIDLGKAPHGLGMEFPSVDGTLPPWSPFDAQVNPLAPSASWYREFTVKNLGNVNALNIQALVSDLVSAQSGVPIFANNIRTSLDGMTDATISKARVGDTEPTILNLPDSRRFESDPALKDNDFGKPKIGMVVPLTQPIGTYWAPRIDIRSANADADPTFALKITVREDRLTDGLVEGALPQIDDPYLAPRPASAGDVQPAAFREINPSDPYAKGNAHMFWSSNRKPDMSTSTVSPNDPWYIFKAKLRYDSAATPPKWGLDTASLSRWWSTSDATTSLTRIPTAFDWPSDPGVQGTIVPNTIKHLSPSVAQDPADGQTWLFWQGQMYRQQPNGPLNQENRVFYTDVTGGAIDNTVYSFSRDFSMVKQSPRGLVYTTTDSKKWMWAFYYGGDAQRWNIFYNAHNSPSSQSTHDPEKWSADMKLSTPDSLSSVSEPIAIKRTINGAEYLDITYTGVSKEAQNSDIYMSRYGISVSSPAPLAVRLTPVVFPRVSNEVMRRDEKRGVYTSRHIWWIRPTLDPSFYNDPNPTVTPTWPVIEIQIPGKKSLYATDPKAVYDKNNPPNPIPDKPEITRDKATGLYIFNYDVNDDRAKPLRQTIIDTSTGTVRFGKPLSAGVNDNDINKIKVIASYNPRALRLSATQLWAGSAGSDTSPFTLLEKTPNTVFTMGGPNVTNPLKCTVDRLWLFWRKPASGVRATTIFYKTFRLGIQLSRPISVGVRTAILSAPEFKVKNSVGPYEIDWDRSRIYFTETDERYPELTNGLGPIEVEYNAILPTGGVQSGRKETFATVSWMPEMEEAALLGSAAESMVNEGQVCAFMEPEVLLEPGVDPGDFPLGIVKGKAWVFWASTRTGLTDLFYETLSPVFRP